MKPIRWALAAVGLVGVVAAATQAPRVLRRMEQFRVARVEVLGTRYLAPHHALAASGITRASSVFDDPEQWKAALLRHPLIVDARIERRLPNTVVLEITEAEPVALVGTRELKPVDARGRVLPIDPAVAPLDLPLLGAPSDTGPDGRLTDPGAITLIRELDRIRRLEPGIADQISEIHQVAGGHLRLMLRQPARAEMLIPPDADPVRLRQVRAVLADLVARGELERLRRIDVRFRDQVVVALDSSASS